MGTEYFKHGIHTPFFPLQNALCFIILTYLVPVLFAFYIESVLKLKKNNSVAKILKKWNYFSLQYPSTSEIAFLAEIFQDLSVCSSDNNKMNYGRVECVLNMTAHAQKPDFVFRAKRTSPFKSARWGSVSSVDCLQPRCAASAVVMLDTPCSEVV